MRLLRVISTLDPRVGGPAAGLRALTPVLSSLGHETEFLTMEAPASEPKFLEAAPVHQVGPPKNGYQYTPSLLPWLRANHARFDAVTVHGLWQYHGRAVREALQGTSTPYFVYPHGMLDPWFRRAYPVKHLKKWLYWQLYERRVLRDAAAVLFTCEQERLLARTTFSPYHCTEQVIRYGAASPPCDLTQAQQKFRDHEAGLGKAPYLLYLSRVHPKKGIDLLLQAYLKLAAENPAPLPTLVIAGPCEDEVYLQSLKKEATRCPSNGKVVWAGMLTGDLKWGALAGAEAFVLPSHQENFGIAVAEALAVGRPVLISDQVNIWREIQAEGACIVNPDTAAGTLNSLRTWLALPAPQRDSMARAAARCFKTHFEMSSVAQSLLTTLHKYTHRPLPGNA